MQPLAMRLVGVFSVVALLSLAPSAAAGEKIAHFHLSGALVETPKEMPFQFSGAQVTSLKDLVERLSKARKADDVKAVVLTFANISMGAGQLEELRAELERFKAVNKRVFIHTDSLSTGQAALFSAASDLSIVPTTDVWLIGFQVEQLFVRELLNKIGVTPDILHIGDYKAAGELLTNTEPSEPARENLNWLLDGLYEGFVEMIAESRGLSARRVRDIIDRGPHAADEALELGLVDSVMYRDQFLDQIKGIYGSNVQFENRYGEKGGPDIDFDNPFAIFSFFSEMLESKPRGGKPAIGIVYVEGPIQTGYAEPNPFGGTEGAFSGNIRNALNEAAEDGTIKAVVLRVDSPGGSALASEIIWRATQQVRARKPLIVSMGNVAGSGGYYVSCGADAIFADRMTITASIGVVGGKLVTTGMWHKLGVNWVGYQRGANADILASDDKFTDQQRSDIHKWMTYVYDVFKGHIQDQRGDRLTKPLEEMAGGRVYTGQQALELGLVDKIGGLSDAIVYAARQAGIDDYEVRVVPEPKNFIDMLVAEMMGKGDRPSDISVGMRRPGAFGGAPLVDAVLPWLQRLEPMRADAVKEALTRIELLHRESVITMMPQTFLVR